MSLEFQIYDFMEEDTNEFGDYIINIFGRTEDDKSVYAKVINYTPYFYIGLPDSWLKLTKNDIQTKLRNLENWLKSKENNKVYYKYKKCLLSVEYVKAKKAEGFNFDKKTMKEKKFIFAKLIFNNMDAMKKYARMFDKYELEIEGFINKPIQYKLYENNLSPMLRCFHIRKISGCSWISIDKQFINNYDLSLCDIEVIVDWKELNPIKKTINAPFKIASFDIECYSHDGQFPQAKRKLDTITQIGITYSRIGHGLPYRKWIACLKETDPIDGVIVKSCKTESDVIDAFIEELNNSDCDIITGWNIFGFDEKYIYDRCKEHLNKESSVSMISKLKDRECKFKITELSSSALGQNILNFWETPGRVHVDLMKYVQNLLNLTCYQLDYVASHLIRGEITNYTKLENNKYELNCLSVKDIQINDYIHIEVIHGFISDDIGDKYLVLDIDKDNKKIYVQGDDNLDIELETSRHGGNIFWSQAKDDIGPSEIFKYQNQGSDKRAIIAKYCVKDCSLINLLINKLETVTNCLEMANVCYVPLNFIFIRGQGIKSFSLCLKQFREDGYIFPTIKIKRNENGEINKEESYEGAIVFDPVGKVDYEANSTKDYASLYPSADIQKNMSHETEVLDSQYDNIEGITYYNAEFKDNDGTIKYLRYAQIENKLGVIPSILSNLLKERKAVKAIQKTEKDDFKWKILEAKQLALKITANSLYGQLGATTSPIARRNIAASITSTGREMLLFAKKYDEETLPWIMNGLAYAYKNYDETKIKYLLDKELKEELHKKKNGELVKRIESYCTNILPNFTIQPVVRYGDTDSVFTCFRFKDITSTLPFDYSLNLLKDIVFFSRELILPYLSYDDSLLFDKYHNKYFSDINNLELPDPFKCPPLSTHNQVILPLKDRIKQFLKEYMYENFLPWLWTLQEVINQNYNNMDKKLGDWAKYLLSKHHLEYNDLVELRKNQVIPHFEKLLNEYYNDEWKLSNDSIINKINILLHDLYGDEITKTTKEMFKLIKNFMDNMILEEWINSKSCHDINLTMEKRKLKKDRNFNDKNLNTIITNFIIQKLKLTFNKYKTEHENTIKKFITDKLQNYIIQPWWDVINGNIKYKINFHEPSTPIIDKRTLDNSMEMGILSGELVKSRLPFPHDLEYEKTFWPFLILTKKRYVGNKYEFDANDFVNNFMGIVLKRRDNAPIVKEICSGIIDFLINKRDPDGAKQFTINFLEEMFTGNKDIKYFLQSRKLKLKESYADWTKIAHVVLADRIAKREGSTLESGNRLEFAVIQVDNPENKKLLQGDRIETPMYIKDNNIPIDYMFYMENQIQTPALQFLDLVDKNAYEIFSNMKAKYYNKVIKPRKQKIVKVIDLGLISDTEKTKKSNFKNDFKYLLMQYYTNDDNSVLWKPYNDELIHDCLKLFKSYKYDLSNISHIQKFLNDTLLKKWIYANKQNTKELPQLITNFIRVISKKTNEKIVTI